MRYNLLVVTDHSAHSASNSLYELALALHADKRNRKVWVCSRGIALNNDFFRSKRGAPVYVTEVKRNFAFDPGGAYLHENLERLQMEDVNVILIRMPQPLDKTFLLSLRHFVPKGNVINDPTGTIETSSKEFLLSVAHLCPSPQMCYSIQDAIEMSHQHEIVLKPLYSYGGIGILRLSPRYFWRGSQRFDVDEIHKILPGDHFPMLAMRYLHNVSFGDKRTIVVNRQVVGSALRMPPPDSWICNVAQGGHALIAQADEEEMKIESELTPLLFEKGVIIYGFDTLVDDNGLRVLSEINTLSIGGMGPMEELSGKPVVKQAASLLWDYVREVHKKR